MLQKFGAGIWEALSNRYPETDMRKVSLRAFYDCALCLLSPRLSRFLSLSAFVALSLSFVIALCCSARLLSAPSIPVALSSAAPLPPLHLSFYSDPLLSLTLYRCIANCNLPNTCMQFAPLPSGTATDVKQPGSPSVSRQSSGNGFHCPLRAAFPSLNLIPSTVSTCHSLAVIRFCRILTCFMFVRISSSEVLIQSPLKNYTFLQCSPSFLLSMFSSLVLSVSFFFLSRTLSPAPTSFSARDFCSCFLSPPPSPSL